MSPNARLSIEQRLDQIESRTQIAALVAAYCEGVDRKNADRFLSLWHDDAAYLIPGGRGDFYNIDGIARALEVIQKAWRETYHWTTNHVVDFETPDRATGRSDAFAICTHHDGRVSHVAATYDDVYERRDGTWRFARRLVTRWFVSAPLDIELLPPF